MKVYMRAIESNLRHYFTKADYEDMDNIIGTLKRNGGVYFDGEHTVELDFQYCLDEDEAYAEIVVGSLS